MQTPIALLVDDSTPLVHLYRNHIKDLHRQPIVTAAGTELAEFVPNDFLERFCQVAGRRGIAGKFSIVPAPLGRGDIVRGMEGIDREAACSWLNTVKTKLGGRFDFSPEMLTHSWAVDLADGKLLAENEEQWAARQDRAALTPYIARALAILKEAGIDATGVTSPWMFGQEVEEEYVAAIVAAQREVYGRDFSWYFLHFKDDPATKPWVAFRDSGATLVSIPCTMDDFLWDTIWRYGSMDSSQIGRVADRYLSKDGTTGRIRQVLDAGGWPVLVAHWQSLYSNGLETGLAVLDEVGDRVQKTLAERVTWSSCMEMARLIA